MLKNRTSEGSSGPNANVEEKNVSSVSQEITANLNGRKYQPVLVETHGLWFVNASDLRVMKVPLGSLMRVLSLVSALNAVETALWFIQIE